VARLDLVLVPASSDGVRVLHATAPVEPPVDPRSDTFVRRLTAPPGDVLHD
jgi:hypothetical protein